MILSKSSLSVICTAIIFSLILCGIDSKCYPRTFGKGGSAKIPNKRLDDETISDNAKVCTKITEPLECVKNDDKCLWIHQEENRKDRFLPFSLEGSRIKNVKYIPTKILSDEEAEKFFKSDDRINIKPEAIKAAKNMNDELFKERIRMRTVI